VRAAVLASCLALAAGSLLMMGGCARDPYVYPSIWEEHGAWEIERHLDRVTGHSIASAYVANRNGSHTSEFFTQPVGIQLLCFKHQPMVRFAFSTKVGSTRNAMIGYSFDEKPGREFEARFVAGQKNVVIEDQAEVAHFIRELAASNLLYVRIRALNFGRATAEFPVDGAPRAIEAAFADCPLPPLTTRQAQARS
jgi:hypothetical protein